jgi:hypothetical protein
MVSPEHRELEMAFQRWLNVLGYSSDFIAKIEFYLSVKKCCCQFTLEEDKKAPPSKGRG